MDLHQDVMPDWDKGLPLDILSKIGGGRNNMKVMRKVCSTWKEGFALGVRHLSIGRMGPFLPGNRSAAAQFPALTGLYLRKCFTATPIQPDLFHFEGFKRLAILSLGFPFNYYKPCNPVNSELVGGLLDAAISNVLPITKLTLYRCGYLQDEGLARLRELPLTFLDLSLCSSVTNTGLQHLQVNRFRTLILLL